MLLLPLLLPVPPIMTIQRQTPMTMSFLRQLMPPWMAMLFMTSMIQMCLLTVMAAAADADEDDCDCGRDD